MRYEVIIGKEDGSMADNYMVEADSRDNAILKAGLICGWPQNTATVIAIRSEEEWASS